MYLNIGGNLSVRAGCVMGVFDLDNTSWSKWTRQFLQQAQAEGRLIEATDTLPKSFVVTQEYGIFRVYLSQYIAAVLEKRLSSPRAGKFSSIKELGNE